MNKTARMHLLVYVFKRGHCPVCTESITVGVQQPERETVMSAFKTQVVSLLTYFVHYW